MRATALAAVGEDERWMEVALGHARRAAEGGEVPVGAVVVRDGALLGAGRNRRQADADPTAHAEVVALREAGRAAGTWHLEGAALYVTLEPCPMCAGAAVNARLGRLVYGCDDPKAGAVRSLYRLAEDGRLNHRLEVAAGVCAAECAELLRAFFAALRGPRRDRC